MILKLRRQYYRELKLYKVYVNDDPGLTLTYFMARSNLVVFVFIWGKLSEWHLKVNILHFNAIANVPLQKFGTVYSGIFHQKHVMSNVACDWST